jgi:hypothetical protein
MPKIYWPAKNMTFTKKDFLALALHEMPSKIYWRMRGDPAVPFDKIKKNDLAGWMAFTGSSFVLY